MTEPSDNESDKKPTPELATKETNENSGDDTNKEKKKPRSAYFSKARNFVKTKLTPIISLLVVFLIALVIWLSPFLRNYLYEHSQNFSVVFVVALLILAVWHIPKWQMASLKNTQGNTNESEFGRAKERLKLEDDARKTFVQIAGGVLLLIGFYLTYKTLELNRQTLDLNYKTQELSREGQITDRFTKAISQLGDDQITVRLGGLYALERIAKDSPKDHWTVMEILSSYVRDKSPRNVAPQNQETKSLPNEPHRVLKVPTDIQTALTIIGRRNIGLGLERQEPDYIDLSNTALQGVKLNDEFVFRDAPEGSFAYHKQAYFETANFANSDLQVADLRQATFKGAIFSFANLSNANLNFANLSFAIFYNTNLSLANLRETDLSFANLSGADLSYTNLKRASLVQTKGLTMEQLTKAIIDENTRLPAEFENQKSLLLEKSKQQIEGLKKVFGESDLRWKGLID